MERKKYIFVILFLFSFFILNAQKTYKEFIYNSYVTGQMNVWKAVIDKMELNKTNNSKNLMELIEYQYGYIAWCIGNDKKSEAEEYLELASKNLEIVEQNGDYIALVYSYKSAFIGFEIGINPVKAPFLGGKSLEYSEKAIEINDKNLLILMNHASLMFYMPSFYGGDKQKAIDLYLKALENADLNSSKNNWLYLNLLTNIGNAYKEIEDKVNAKYYYEYALKVEPNFKYVKDELLPELSN